MFSPNISNVLHCAKSFSDILKIQKNVPKHQNPCILSEAVTTRIIRQISEEAGVVDRAHCKPGSFAAKSDFKFGQIRSPAHVGPIKKQSV